MAININNLLIQSTNFNELLLNTTIYSYVFTGLRISGKNKVKGVRRNRLRIESLGYWLLISLFYSLNFF